MPRGDGKKEDVGHYKRGGEIQQALSKGLKFDGKKRKSTNDTKRGSTPSVDRKEKSQLREKGGQNARLGEKKPGITQNTLNLVGKRKKTHLRKNTEEKKERMISQ